jgi:hypothetical protein
MIDREFADLIAAKVAAANLRSSLQSNDYGFTNSAESKCAFMARL